MGGGGETKKKEEEEEGEVSRPKVQPQQNVLHRTLSKNSLLRPSVHLLPTLTPSPSLPVEPWGEVGQGEGMGVGREGGWFTEGRRSRQKAACPFTAHTKLEGTRFTCKTDRQTPEKGKRERRWLFLPRLRFCPRRVLQSR